MSTQRRPAPAEFPRPHPLVTELRRRLRSAGDSARAAAMQSYMKSPMPFHGVPTPVMRALTRELIAAHPLTGFGEWHDTTLELWRGARFREERYAAIELTGHRLYRDHQLMKSLPLYEELIVTGAWWDLVDGVAGNRLGPLLERYQAPMHKRMLTWSRSPDRWKRRSSIICQLRFKQATDLELLYACIEANLADPDFFIRKAIGWALRQYAWTDAAEIRRYVGEHVAALSPLSRREALKNIGA
jgi:3-methyladenine DNA glycosylase AlkD